MPAGVGYTDAEARAIFNEYIAGGGDPRSTNIEAIKAGILPGGFNRRPPTNTGAVGDTRQPPSMEDISSLLLGRLPFAQRQAVAHQFGIVPSGQGFQMDALNALINRGSLEGAPPAPFETKFANTPALVDALLTRRVDPRVLDRAKSGLLKQMQAAQTVPPSLLRGR